MHGTIREEKVVQTMIDKNVSEHKNHGQSWRARKLYGRAAFQVSARAGPSQMPHTVASSSCVHIWWCQRTDSRQKEMRLDDDEPIIAPVEERWLTRGSPIPTSWLSEKSSWWPCDKQERITGTPFPNEWVHGLMNEALETHVCLDHGKQARPDTTWVMIAEHATRRGTLTCLAQALSMTGANDSMTAFAWVGDGVVGEIDLRAYNCKARRYVSGMMGNGRLVIGLLSYRVAHQYTLSTRSLYRWKPFAWMPWRGMISRRLNAESLHPLANREWPQRKCVKVYLVSNIA